MRELIKKGAYSVTAPRTITVTDGRQFNEEDIRLIYNETKDEVLVSSGEKVGVTVVDEVITIPNDKAAIDTNDILTIEIDFPQKLQQLPEFSFDVTFQNTSTSFTISQPGILTSFGDTTNIKIKPVDTYAWIDISLPYFVDKGDKIFANAVQGTTHKCIIQYTSLSGSAINTGQLGSGLINGCNNFAYYSDALGVTVISGLATFDETQKLLVGDGFFTATAGYRQLPFDSNYVEHDGYLYMFSDERASIIKVNLTTFETTLIPSGATANNFYKVKIIGDYIYFFGHTNSMFASLTSNSYGVTIHDQGVVVDVVADSTSVYQANGHLDNIYKITGTSIPSTLNSCPTEKMVIEGAYLYSLSSNNVKKINKSDMTVASSITTNYTGVVVYAFVDNGFLVTMYQDGTITRIDLSAFATISDTISLGAAIVKPSVKVIGRIAYIIGRNVSTFYKLDMTTFTSSSYTLINEHNCVSIDDSNNRLIFYSHQVDAGITLKPVEITAMV